MKRRHFILGAGGAVALAGTGVAWRVMQTSRTATVPWQFDPAPLADVRLDAFRYAILAPNPHNRQPWTIRLEGKSGALIGCDLSRRLAATDPFDRQIVVGFGAFLELARIAAAERGFRMDIDLFPEGEPQPRLDTRPIARLNFVRDAALRRDPLFAQIVNRRSNKEAFDLQRPITAALASQISTTDAAFTVAPPDIVPLRAAILDAVTTETQTRRTYMESVDLIRIGHKAIDASPDGIDLGGPTIEALKLAGLIDHAQLADMDSVAYKSGLDGLLTTYGSIPALIWIVTPSNTRADQIDAGRRYVRANLRATALGISMHPMSQSLQEYPEVSEPFSAVHKLLHVVDGGRVQMLARIGYAALVGPAPRWPLETRLIP